MKEQVRECVEYFQTCPGYHLSLIHISEPTRRS